MKVLRFRNIRAVLDYNRERIARGVAHANRERTLYGECWTCGSPLEHDDTHHECKRCESRYPV